MTLGGLLALADQVETQACTREQNRICTCKPGSYCTLPRQEGCRLCATLSRCRPGFGVGKPGMGAGPAVLRVPRGPPCVGVSVTALPGIMGSGGQVLASQPAVQPSPLSSFLQHEGLGTYCVLSLGGSREGSD